MSINKKGMRKEWHYKRIDYRADFILDLLNHIDEVYGLSDLFNSDVSQAYHALFDSLYEFRGSLKVDELCGQYLVEYGYNLVPDSNAEEHNNTAKFIL